MKPYTEKQSVKVRSLEINKSLILSQSEEIRRKFLDIFASELSQTKLCTIKKHTIDTGTNPPICQKEHRTPIHLEDKV